MPQPLSTESGLDQTARGTVIAIRGSVVDVQFPARRLPRIEDALVIEDRETGRVLVEVQAHVAEDRVRALALAATAGLRRSGIGARRSAAVTAIEAVYVPADDFTDPAVTTIAAHVDSMMVL